MVRSYPTYLIRVLVVLIPAFFGCELNNHPDPGEHDPGMQSEFPSFITPVEEYFDIRIGPVPEIDADTYLLRISGAVNHPSGFALEELRNREMVEKTITVECIENPAGGPLMGTAIWKGFRLYDLLKELGIGEEAATVKYICADGYYTYNTLEELREGGVIGALYMNDSILPAHLGFPLRFIFPGYYGVRHPGWIVEIEVMESEAEDYWSRSGWKTETPMAVDTRIFFPAQNSRFTIGDTIRIGGAAFGAKRISAVDVTVDYGTTWIPATIIQESGQDYSWVFWEVALPPQSAGNMVFYSRAISSDGTIQPWEDTNFYDGTNSLPSLTISVTSE